ncbi:hypothetical protein D3C75_542910 [compost metagenome]
MAAVEHTQLHLFERDHVGHQLGACFLPRRTTGNKIVFYDPLTERFAGHTCRIAHAGDLFDFVQGIGSNGGHNTVNHCRREGDVGFDPVGQLAINRASVGAGDIAHHMTVLGHVVAGHYGKGGQARRFTPRQRFDHHANGGARLVRVIQIGSDQRMIEHQLSGCRGVAVAFLGDGQRDNRNLRLAHRRQHHIQTIDLRMQGVFHHPDDPRSPGIGRHFCHGVEIVLGFEVRNLLLTANQVDLAKPPVAAVFGGKNIGIHRLVSTMEGAKTQMHYFRLQVIAVVVRQGCLRME